MPSSFARRLSTGLVAACSLAAACTSTQDPFRTGPARAAVTGVVTDAQGAPVPVTSIRITCSGGGAAAIATTDSVGRYLASISTGSSPFLGSSGKLACHFAQPATGVSRAQLDTLLGFARGPVLVALQFVDLHER